MLTTPHHGALAHGRWPPIAALPTAVALFIGCAARGPTNVAVRVRSRAECDAAFGPPDVDHPLGYSVGHYFDNGGTDAWIIALAATSTTSQPFAPNTAAFAAALVACVAPDGAVDGAVDGAARFDLLCVPGENDPTTLATLQAQCARRDAFCIADCAIDATAASLARGPDPALLGADAASSALYAPWVVAIDRSSGATRPFPPCGFVAGVFARIDAAHGVWKAPAGLEATLVGALGLTATFAGAEAVAINATGFDTLMAFPGHGIVVWSARTLSASGGAAGDRYVPVRRLVAFIASSVRAGTAWTTSIANAPPLWTALRSVVSDFLQGLFARGAFAGPTARQAYFVRCDATTMTQADLDAGRLVVQIGIAPLRPAEFVVLRIVLCARCPG